jgi:hypothetical protein
VKWNAVKVIYQNYDGYNKQHILQGKYFATAVGVGEYTGGFLRINSLTYNCKYSPFVFELKELTLENVSSGYRYFILFYNI